MSSRIAFPFLTLPPNCVDAAPILIGDPGTPLAEASAMIDHWDYARDLELSSHVAVDFNRACDALQIPVAELSLIATLRIGTGAGMMPRRIVTKRDLLIGAETSAKFTLVLPGHSLSAQLVIETSIVLGSAPVTVAPLSPTTPGDRLWRRTTTILLEDSRDSRFPMEILSFADSFTDRLVTNAPWYLSWTPHALGQDFSTSVRLYINADHPDTAQRLADGDPATLRLVMADTIGQMIGTVLSDSDLWEDLNEQANGTVGHQVAHWLELAFPGMATAGVAQMRRDQPGRYRAAILSAAEFTGEIA